MFCSPGLIFVGTEGIGSRFHVLLARTRFRRYRGHRVQLSGFARSDSFSAVSCASGPVFMFGAPVLILRSTGAWGPVFMFYAPGLIFGGTECVWSRFHVLRVRSRFKGYRGVGSRFHVLRARTRYRRYRVRRVPFSCFVRPDTFSTVLRRRVLFSCFARPNSFSAVRLVSGPIFMFCVPGLVFGGTEGVGCRFHVLHSRNHCRRHSGRRVPFSYFALRDSFSIVPRASGPFFMF
jgi:hypothetical protein